MAGRFQYRRKGILPVDIHILFIHRQLHKIYQEKSYYREETIINCGNTICTCNLDTYLFFRYRESYYWFIVLCYSRKYCILLLDKKHSSFLIKQIQTQLRGMFVHPPQLMRETIGRPPHWFVRYGTALVALALLALGAVGYCFYTIP